VNRRTLIELLSAPLITRQLSKAAQRDRVVIAGAGIMGASIAYHLAVRGADVTVLERQQPGSGATRNSFAWLNATFSKQPRSYYELNLAGIAGWRRLSLLFRDLQVQWGGSVQWSSPGDGALRLRSDIARHEAWGYSVHRIDGAEIPTLLPAIAPGPVGAACFADQEGTVDPIHALTVFLDHAKAMGAKIEFPAEVTGIAIANGRVAAVESSRGKFPCDFLVLAAGVDTQRLARLVEINVPLKDSPGALAHAKPSARLLDRVALAPGANIKQNPDGRIVTGTDFGGTPLISLRDMESEVRSGPFGSVKSEWLLLAHVDEVKIRGHRKLILLQRRLHALPFDGGLHDLPVVLRSHADRHGEGRLVGLPAVRDRARGSSNFSSSTGSAVWRRYWSKIGVRFMPVSG
jgi:glycine/D-amino acid oxidase-like deaminating enzyme